MNRLTVVISVCVTIALALAGALTWNYVEEDRERKEAQEILGQQLNESMKILRSRGTELGAQIMNTIAVEESRPAAQEALDQAKSVLSESKDKVLDNDVRQDLADLIEDSEVVIQSEDLAGVESIAPALASRVEAVNEAVQDWEEEQERIRLEREEQERREREERERREREAREAAERAAQQQRQSAAASSSGSSGNNSSGSSQSSRSSSSASNSSSSAASAPTRSQRAQAILAQHGCGSVPVRWDDARLAGWNGAYDPNTVEILLNSKMPESRFNYVVAHECAHYLQYRVYNDLPYVYDNQQALYRDMNAIYGGGNHLGAERNADCITQRWGYSTYNYTTSCGGDKGEAARAIINGHKP